MGGSLVKCLARAIPNAARDLQFGIRRETVAGSKRFLVALAPQNDRRGEAPRNDKHGVLDSLRMLKNRKGRSL